MSTRRTKNIVGLQSNYAFQPRLSRAAGSVRGPNGAYGLLVLGIGTELQNLGVLLDVAPVRRLAHASRQTSELEGRLRKPSP
jgi:hypothetical protein